MAKNKKPTRRTAPAPARRSRRQLDRKRLIVQAMVVLLVLLLVLSVFAGAF